MPPDCSLMLLLLRLGLHKRLPASRGGRNAPWSATERALPAEATPARCRLVAQRIADLPQRRSPQSNEQRSALGVAALLLVDRLRSDPESDAKSHRPCR